MKKRSKAITRLCLALLLLTLLLPISSRAVENSDCLECHSDESLERDQSTGMKQDLYVDEVKFRYSVHNANDISCTDCHSDITELDFDNEVPHAISLPVKCENCHEAEAEAYVDSVHKKASGKGITIPCYACHGYHYVTHLEADSVYERENGFCLKCHNPNKHHEWLPQMETHFSYVECTVCHAMEAPRYVNLRLFDLLSEEFVGSQDILKLLKTNADEFQAKIDTNGDGEVDMLEFEEFNLMLRANKIRSSFHGELVVDLVPNVHHVNRGAANRECEQCHMPTSPFFQDVRFTINRDDGTSDHVKVTREVLSSYYVNHFYALGGTRIRMLDKIGLAICAGGAGVVFAHFFARILTAPGRRKRKKKEKAEAEEKSALRYKKKGGSHEA